MVYVNCDNDQEDGGMKWVSLRELGQAVENREGMGSCAVL
jgi:hypothetical protein